MGISREEFEKFTKDREEIKNKILEFYDSKTPYELFRLQIVNKFYDQLKNDYKILIEQKNKQPMMAIYANKLLLFNAIFMLLNENGQFYENLYGVLTLKEMEMADGPWFSLGVTAHPKSEEECDVLREMILKSPGEIEKIKKQLENE